MNMEDIVITAQPQVSFTFDDGYRSVYTKALARMAHAHY